MNKPVFKRLSIHTLWAALLICSPLAAAEDGAMHNTISVTGTASASVDPDLVSVAFGVEVQGDTAAAALATNSEHMAKVIAALRDAGIGEDEIATSQFNIYPVYDRHQDKQSGVHTQVLVGYRVSNIVIVETGQLDKVAGIIDAAVGAGVNRVDRVAFGLSPEVRERLQDEMIEAAVLNARGKAEQALAPLGQVIAGVRQVSLAEFAAPGPVYEEVRMLSANAARSAPTQIFASDQDVRTTVNVTFLIAPE